MSSLILNAGTASPIVLNCTRLGKGANRIVGSKTYSFNGTERSSVRGQAKTIPVSTSLVDTATEAAIQAAISSGKQIPCSGDVLQNIQTVCSVDCNSSEMVPGVPGFFTMTLTVYEVNASVVLLKYSPGDTITGESFSRSTTATYFDANGVLQTAPINAKRDGDYIGGVRSLLLEDTRINSALWSRDLTNAAWTGPASAGQNAIGLDGTPNSGTTLTDNTAIASQYRTGTAAFGIANDNAPHAAAVWVRKDTDQTRFPALYAYLANGTGVNRRVQLNTQTGAVVSVATNGVSTFRVIDDGLWWKVEIDLTNNSTGNTASNVEIYPADGTVFGVSSLAAQGSCVIGQVEREVNQPFSSSPILTTAATVTRAADSYSLPFTQPPMEMTLYAKFVELGTLSAGGSIGILDLGNTAALFIFNNGGFYGVIHRHSVDVSSTLALAPALGQVNELRALLFGDGSVQIGQSIAGGVETIAPQSAANPLASAWDVQTILLNNRGTGPGFIALQSLKIVAGARSLSEMRSL